MQFLSNIGSWARSEPARAYLLVRALLTILAGTGLAIFSPEHLEQVATLIAVLLGVDVATTEGTRSNVYSPDSAERIAGLVSTGPMTEAGAYVVRLVKGLVPTSLLPAALSVVAPIISEFANRALTPDVRGELQSRVHAALRKAGILRGRNLTPTSLLVLLGLTLVLTACSPASRFATGAVNEIGGDQAVLGWVEENGATVGVAFHPGDTTALEVVLDIQGTDLQLVDQADECEVNEAATVIQCHYAEVVELVTVRMFGLSVTGSASYRRSPDGRHYLEFLTD